MDMFSSIFAYVKQMAWSVTFIIPIVLIARYFFGKVSKRLCYLLWGIVAVRLLCPVLLPSDLSLFHYVELAQRKTQAVLPQTQLQEWQFTDDPEPVLWEHGNEAVLHSAGDNKNIVEDVRKTSVRLEWQYYAWIAGMFGMSGYAFFSCLLLKWKLRYATKRKEGVYECETVGSPFVFGLIKPVIYLPYHLSEKERDYILQHEYYHIRRRDYLIKWFAYFLLAMYWFHPLVWAAYIFMNQDMEMGCDEHVLRDCTETERKEYGTLLLRFASEKNGRMIVTLSFGEKSIKQRIFHVLHYKKRTALASAAAILFLIVLAVVCLTDANPKLPGDEVQVGNTTEEEDISQAAIDLYAAANPYIGDVPANGKLMGVISEYFGGFGTGATTELQTSEEPYCLTLHFSEKPDENAMWWKAVLLLALIENCGEVDWDYESGNEKITIYVPAAEVNNILGIEDIKEYGTSAEKVQELLDITETEKREKVQELLNIIETETEKREIIRETLSHLPDDPRLSSADIFIIGEQELSRYELWEFFQEKVSMGEPADIILASMTKEGDVLYRYVSYDGEVFYVMQDNSRDTNLGDGEAYSEHIYSNLLVEDYSTARGNTFRIAVLDNDASLTYKDIEASWVSSVDSSLVDAYFLFSVDLDEIPEDAQ